jgi:phage terminase small subunit
LTLTPKQQRFVAEYLIDLNATQAAIRAGYSAKTATEQGSRLLTHVQVAAQIADGKARQLAAVQTTVDVANADAELSAIRVLEEYRRLAFADVRSFFDANGNVKSMQDLTPEQGSALAGFEVLIKNAKAGDGVTDTVHKFRLWDKTRALESLAKHFGLLTERVEHSGDVSFRWLTPAEKS